MTENTREITSKVEETYQSHSKEHGTVPHLHF